MFITLLFWFFAYTRVKGLSLEDQLQDANGNSTILREMRILGWKDGPSFRGTGDILWSCLVTIVAAVYTAIHPDIPVRHESQWERFRVRARWAFAALIAPEMMLRLAVKQFFNARALLKQLNGINAKQNTATTAPAKKYNMAYAFYIEMGGFVVDTSHISSRYSLMALTARGAICLAKVGHVFDVDMNQLSDRSKSGTFAKLLVCFQISWMFLQCVARGVSGYPLTLLEIHTMTHVVCAILIYFCWWHKPNDIGESQLWDANGFEDVVAFLTMSEVTCSDLETGRDSNYYFSSEFERLRYSPDPEINSRAIANAIVDNHSQMTRLEVGDYLPCGLGPAQYFCTLDNKGLERWKLAAEALGRSELVSTSDLHGNNLRRISISHSGGIATSQHAKGTTGYKWRVWDWEAIYRMIFNLIDDNNKSVFFSTAIFLPLIYGGVHMTAWNFQFPSQTEAYLWKISSITIMSVGPVALMIILMIIGLSMMLERVKDLSSSALDLVVSFIGIIGACSLIPFTICRLYLVVEAFISLRDLPLGAFATTPWLQAIPHI